MTHEKWKRPTWRRVEFEKDDGQLIPELAPEGPLREYIRAKSKQRSLLVLADDRDERNCGNCGALAVSQQLIFLNRRLYEERLLPAPTLSPGWTDKGGRVHPTILNEGNHCTWFGEDLYTIKSEAPQFGENFSRIYSQRCDPCRAKEYAFCYACGAEGVPLDEFYTPRLCNSCLDQKYPHRTKPAQEEQ